MTLWSRLCCYGYGVQARMDGLWHILRGHDLRWYGGCIDLWAGHMGCIVCDECPDSHVEDGKRVGMVLWTRHNRLLAWLGQKVCGLMGHPIYQFARQFDRYVEDDIYCYRCMADSKLRREWLPSDLTDSTTQERDDPKQPEGDGGSPYQVH